MSPGATKTHVQAPAGYVLGDGTTAGSVASERWRRWRWAGIVTLIVVGSVLAMALLAPRGSTDPLAIDNPRPDGARAVAQVLREQGVDVRPAFTLLDAHELLDGEGTLVIATYAFLSFEQIASINAYPGPVVWLAPDSYALEEIDLALSYTSDFDTPEGGRLTVAAECALATPQRAEAVSADSSRIAVVTGTPGFTVCFGVDDAGSGVYVQQERFESAPAVILADASIVMNEHIATSGNAALTLGTLGTRDRLVWYTGAPWDDTTLTSDQGASDYYEPVAPTWLAPAMLAAVLTALTAAVWQGRRFGALVTEPLPLIVRASEATRGRARLYRRGGARNHALAALRAGAATRLASRLALPRTAHPDALVAAVAAASGRTELEVRTILFDATANDDAAMVDLVRRIDALESEVDPT
jgi:hypothetical protein